jgi:hypothetical protein
MAKRFFNSTTLDCILMIFKGFTEAAQRKTQKDTDNFLMSRGMENQ